MADRKNTISIDVEIDEKGQASASLKSLEGDVLRFTAGVNKAGGEGVRLREVFAGNVLADFFQRGVTGAIQFTAASVRAVAVAEDSNRQLEFSATQAGLSYTKAADAAEDFGRRVGASNTEASRTLSDLIRLAQRAGRAEDLDLIERRFADLAAARGLRGEELSNLIGTILSGQDEGLNRLGLPDPSKLYAQYAAGIGKTADSLNETEKARAALNAVLEKGAEADGQAEARLLSTAGKLDSASASYENLRTQTGETITTSIEFRDVLDTVTEALGSVVTSHARARRELALGLKSPEQIAQEERDSTGRQIFNAFKGGVTIPFAGGASLYDTYLGLTGQITREEAIARGNAYEEAVFNPGQRQYEARVEQLRALKAEIERQEAAAAANAGAAGAKAAAASQRSELQQAFAERLEAASKDEDLSGRLGKLRELKEELRTLPGVLDPADFEKRSKKIDEAIRETAKQVAAAVRTARDAARDLLGEALVQSDRENPFISLFVRARTEAEETRRQFLIFGEDFANVMARVREESIKSEIVTVRFQSSLQALKFEQEARRLDSPFSGATGAQERALDVLAARLAGVEKDSELARRQRALESPYRPFTALDAQREAEGQLRYILGLDTSGAGRGGREAQAQAIIGLLNQFDPKTVGTSPLPFFRQLRQAGIGAFQVQRDALTANVEEALQRERAGNRIQADARELLDLVGGSGLTRAQQLKEFLAVTGALSEKELTPDLRQARAEFLREAARAESNKEAQAEVRAQLLANVLSKLDRLLTERGVKVDAPPSNVRFNLGDGLTVDRALLGSTPTAEAEAPFVGFAPGFRD